MSWQIDPAHSQVNFSIRHMMISYVRGRFENFTGVVNFDETNPEKSSVEVNIDASSINTREPNRDGHLRSPDFLDAANFPHLNFKATRMEVHDSNHGRIHGELTIRGISKPVVLDVEYAGQSRMWGKTAAGFSASTRINRKDWNLTWNQTLETGGILVGDEININIELEIIKEAEPVAEAKSL